MFTVLNGFSAFGRGYARDASLTESDLSCWLPADARDEKLRELVAKGDIEFTNTPKTIGGDAQPTPMVFVNPDPLTPAG